MATQTSMLHVRIDNELKMQATETLSQLGLTVSDAVRILLTRIAKDQALPIGLIAGDETYDKWFREKVQQALKDQNPSVPHNDVMDEVQTMIDRKRHRAGS
ncbi:type II toxin-antitoxin system RelB family antitoxin [Phyllobacterium sp. K27]